MPLNYNDKANSLIDYLVTKSSPIWRTALAEAYEGNSDGAKAVALSAKKIDRLRIDESAVLGVAGGPLAHATACFNEAEGAEKLLPSQLNTVVSILKENDRILQVGGGRGRATLILSTDRIIAADNANMIDSSDSDSLVKALIKQLADYQSDIANLRLQNTELIQKHQAITEEIRVLQNENNLYSNATWS